ncbi:MAG: hypothetical protein P9L99_03955 [Candidatus Lernaella stagnicola]|nr:hypothetical protein [Candidatus Lernaella stagnicola]
MEFTYAHDPQANLDVVRGDGLTLTVRRLGAEMIGLTRRHPTRGEFGLIWRDACVDDPPNFWKGHATVLFPIVGGVHNLRSRTTDGIDVSFKKQHGFARHSQFELLGHAGDDEHYVLNYHLIAGPETLALYPWRFELWIRYALYADHLEQQMTVRNLDEKPMPFQLGWHPGFNTPQISGEKASCHLRLPAGESVQVLNDPDCYLTGETRRVTLDGDFPFTEKELDGTYMFDLSATPSERRVVELLDPDESTGVRVEFPDYPHLGIWSDADAPFICIEPWQGMDDSVTQEAFDEKFGVVLLKPGGERVYHAAIHVLDK